MPSTQSMVKASDLGSRSRSSHTGAGLCSWARHITSHSTGSKYQGYEGSLPFVSGQRLIINSYASVKAFIMSQSTVFQSHGHFISTSLRKLAHAICKEFFSAVTIKNFIGKCLIFSIFVFKTLIVGTHKNRLAEAVLTSTHNLSFG